MKVTQVAIRPTEASIAAGRPSLTPELLAASGARYSRNNDGLEAILAKIDPDDLDKSVDSIFRMIDYGHQSIADMVPVALFIDGISIWLAYHLWSLCPTAGGQESSTRYIEIGVSGLIAPDRLGIPEPLHSQWRQSMEASFEAYQSDLQMWESFAADDPTVARIPSHLVVDQTSLAKKQVARMRRNYGFDRARYLLPVAAATNLMMVMSARGWVQLCQNLLSELTPEARSLGSAIREELRLCAPRMLKHATSKTSIEKGILRTFEAIRSQSNRANEGYLKESSTDCEHPSLPQLQVMLPEDAQPADFGEDLSFHDNRYAWIGYTLRRSMVRFRWQAVALAELRDLNRHRTGTKYSPLIPQGFYAALDQVPKTARAEETRAKLKTINSVGHKASALSLVRLNEGDPTYAYWSLLGTQFSFEHVTTADKFIYEAELRTGTGAHFRYAKHLRDVLGLWYEKFPETKGLVLEGSAEPE